VGSGVCGLEFLPDFAFSVVEAREDLAPVDVFVDAGVFAATEFFAVDFAGIALAILAFSANSLGAGVFLEFFIGAFFALTFGLTGGRLDFADAFLLDDLATNYPLHSVRGLETSSLDPVMPKPKPKFVKNKGACARLSS
jgi:hypothetical protein